MATIFVPSILASYPLMLAEVIVPLASTVYWTEYSPAPVMPLMDDSDLKFEDSTATPPTISLVEGYWSALKSRATASGAVFSAAEKAFSSRISMPKVGAPWLVSVVMPTLPRETMGSMS